MRTRNTEKIFKVIVLTSLFMLAFAITAFADGGDGIVEGVTNGAKQVYNVIAAIVGPIAAVLVAFNGIKLLIGGEKGMEKCKTFLIIGLIALFLVFGAGMIVYNAESWFNNINDPIFGGK